MPFGSEGVEPGVGLALSGGGFRATLFHVGALWRLNELGYLPKLDRISSVSGGSITAGLLAVRWPQLRFVRGTATNFKDLLVAPLRAFCARAVDAPAMGEGAFLPGRHVSEALERTSRSHPYGDAALQALPARPSFVLNTTTATGVSFRFSKPDAGDYRIGRIRQPPFRVAQALVASSAFPPVLSSPVLEMDPGRFPQTDGPHLHAQEAQRFQRHPHKPRGAGGSGQTIAGNGAPSRLRVPWGRGESDEDASGHRAG